MKTNPVIVAGNGSPHSGAGNSALMLAMIDEALEANGCALDVLNVAAHRIE